MTIEITLPMELVLHRVPQHDRRGDKVQTARPVALLLEAPVPDFAELV